MDARQRVAARGGYEVIQIIFDNGLSCPTVYCDVCDKPINKDDPGIYCYKPGKDGERVSLHYAHKGECDKELKQRIGATCWADLRALPMFMLRNMDAMYSDAVERAGISF